MSGNPVVTAILALVAIVVVGFLVLRTRGTVKPKPTPPVPSPGIPAPAVVLHEILDLMNMPPNGGWIEGNLVKFGVTYWEQGCPPNVRKNGFEDNGTGPYECKITATIRETKSIQPVYRQDNHEFCNDQWVPCNPGQAVSQGGFYMRLGGRRGWAAIGEPGCSGDVHDVPLGPVPDLGSGDTFIIDWEIVVRNVAGSLSEIRRHSARVLQRKCSGNPDEGTVASPGPCKPCQ